MNAYLARCASLAILALRHGHVALALRLWDMAGQSRHGLTLDWAESGPAMEPFRAVCYTLRSHPEQPATL